jgi:hypothetical protein
MGGGGPDLAHRHYWGIFYYYLMTGDETIRDSFHSIKPMYTQQVGTYAWRPRIPYVTGQSSDFPPRAEANYMLSASVFGNTLSSIGDPDGPAVMAAADHIWTVAVKPDACASGYPAGCVMPHPTNKVAGDPVGVSRVRGMFLSSGGRGTSNCQTAATLRISQPFQQAIVAESLMIYSYNKGPLWAERQLAQNLMYGISQWALTEGSQWDGQPHWWTGGSINGSNPSASMYNGMSYWALTDVSHACPEGTPIVKGHPTYSDTVQFPGSPVIDLRAVPYRNGDIWMHFYAQWLVTGKADWLDKARAAFIRSNATTGWSANWGSYRVALMAHAAANAGKKQLQDLPFSVTDLGGGKYHLSFSTPASVSDLRIKWSAKKIAPSDSLLGYNVFTQKFALSPDVYENWFAAADVPATATPGAQQSIEVTAGVAGLGRDNFSLKAYVSGVTGEDPSPASTLSLVSGNVQTGQPGETLGQPFVIRISDLGGSPIVGVTVNFTVTAGGGTVNPAVATTNSQGLASTVLTLGATVGNNAVVASSSTLSGSSVTFTATATAVQHPSATRLDLVSGNTQTGAVGQQLPVPLTVRATDADGKPVSGVPISFVVTAGGGFTDPLQVNTDSDGLASTTLTVGPTSGTNTVVATFEKVSSPVTFTAVSVKGASSRCDLNGDSRVDVLDVQYAIHQTVVTATCISADLNRDGSCTESDVQRVIGAALGMTCEDIGLSSTTIRWAQKTPSAPRPKAIGYVEARYDPVSKTVLHYGIPQGGIYSTTMWSWNPSAGTWGYGAAENYNSSGNSCTLDKPNLPGDRHPYGQTAIDTRRNRLWMMGGVNQTCGGSTVNTNDRVVTWTCCGVNVFNSSWVGETVTINNVSYTVESVESATSLTLNRSAGMQTEVKLLVSADNRQKTNTYYLSLNSEPALNGWTRVTTPTTFLRHSASMVYVPGTDVLLIVGGGSTAQTHLVYCPTDLNPNPGVLTVEQSQAGCVRPDDWNVVTPKNGTVRVSGTTVTLESGDQFPAAFPHRIFIKGAFRAVASRNSETQLTLKTAPGDGTFDYYIAPYSAAMPSLSSFTSRASLTWNPMIQKVLLYGGADGADLMKSNETWAYDVAEKKWTPRCSAPCSPPPVATTSQVPVAYIPTTGRLLYRQVTGVGAPADWEYDPIADAWTQVVSSGAGPTNSSHVSMVYDPETGKVIALSLVQPYLEVYEGTVETSSGTPQK